MKRYITMGQPSFGGNELTYLKDCFETTRLTQGHWVERFEKTFAGWVGAKHAVAVTNGTAALHLALAALKIGPGDEVIVPALTFVATANAVKYTGATPIIVDVDPDTWCLDWEQAVRETVPETKAVIPVHLFGNVCTPPLALEVPAVHDGCEAIGGSAAGVKVGAAGVMTCFSFYGNKTITTGEGGMITTNDPALDKRLRLLRGQAQGDKPYWHTEIGYNYRMTDLQGAVGCGQMEALNGILEWRDNVAALYHEFLHGVTFQKTTPGTKHANWAMACLLPENVDRDSVIVALRAQYGIETRPVFYPLNHLPPYMSDGCPVASRIAKRGLMLPLHAELTDEDVLYVCAAVENVIQ